MIAPMITKRVSLRLAATMLIASVHFFMVSNAFAEDWKQPWMEPLDTDTALRESNEYAWRLFVALNWPVDPASGAADPSRRLGDEGAVVWQYWQNAKAIFLARGADPGAWKGARNNDPVPAADRFEGLPLNPLIPTKHIIGGVMTNLTDPIKPAAHLDETRMNRASFEYIRSRKLYSLEGQNKFRDAEKSIVFPAAARHVKAQWRPIAADQRSRYFSIEIVMADGSRRLYGLTALHIATKDLPNWFWATFEHVDNGDTPGSAPWLLKSHDSFACGKLSDDCNRAPSDIGLEGTVWQNYRLRGVMTDFVDARGKPTRLANSQLESNVEQTSASCMTCHARATLSLGLSTKELSMQGNRPARLSKFDDEGDSASSVSRSGVAPRPGFVGLPKPEWYVESSDGQQREIYAPMDFVWSLEKAQAADGYDNSQREDERAQVHSDIRSDIH